MAKSLVVVESPTKVRTLTKYLGSNFIIKASVGHVKDLPKTKLGVDVKKGFSPAYVVIKGKQKIIDEIREAASRATTIYLAPDPDREGEAIAWHIANELASNKIKPKIKATVLRILIEEITKKGVERALASPLPLNKPRFESQQARRILDRLVGYQISPLLWEKVRRGLSAGRVQSVALRLIVEREREVQAFIPVEYWSIDARLEGKKPPPFLARLLTKDGEKLELGNETDTRAIESELRKAKYIVDNVVKKQRRRSPPAPFTTSKLQQDAARKLGFTAKKTMMIAQQLYEGVELGAEGAVGLITYLRTDSTRLSEDALGEARTFVQENYGAAYLPEKPRIYRAAKAAQDAHEAIRPTLTQFTPDRVKDFLKRDQLRLYRLIWDRFIACQMNDALFDQTTIDIGAGNYGLRTTGSVLTFDGFMKLYMETEEEGDKEQEDELGARLPDVSKGEELKFQDLESLQHFTKPPPRFTEASLVKELEEKGIGRPSTYASILSTIQDRKYSVKDQGRFTPTELGILVCDLLVKHFPEVLDVDFTAQMESQLDKVEEGETEWQEVLKTFYGPFSKALSKAKDLMRDVKREETPTDFVCERCQKPMVIKWGRHGHFLACSGYPECRNTKEFRKGEDGSIQIIPQATTDEICEKCNSPMVVKTGRFGKFLACSRYPECKTTKSVSTGVKCPEPGCTGQLAEKRSKKGRVFYGCSKYPNCKHASWDKPLKDPCPKCGSPYLVEKYTKAEGPVRKCPKKECDFSESIST